MLSGCKAHHDEELGLNVMLPLNISLDLGQRAVRDTQLSNALVYMDASSHVICGVTRFADTWMETMVKSYTQIEKGREPLDLTE